MVITQHCCLWWCPWIFAGYHGGDCWGNIVGVGDECGESGGRLVAAVGLFGVLVFWGGRDDWGERVIALVLVFCAAHECLFESLALGVVGGVVGVFDFGDGLWWCCLKR